MRGDGGVDWGEVDGGDAEAYGRVLDAAFGLVSPARYLDDFPVWDPARAAGAERFSVAGRLGGKLVATASARFVDFRGPGSTERRFGLIGAVATVPGFQGRGLGRRALAAVLGECDRRAVDACVLWGSESALYRDAGFRFEGGQHRGSVGDFRRALLAAGGGAKVPRCAVVERGWREEIGRFFLDRPTGVKVERRDLGWISAHRNVEWRSLRVGDELRAVIAFNRGIDLPGIVHELEGDLPALGALLAEALLENPRLEVIFSAPVWESKLGGPLPLDPNAFVREPLAQVRWARGGGEADSSALWFTGLDAC